MNPLRCSVLLCLLFGVCLSSSGCIRSTDPVPPPSEGAFLTGTVVTRDLASGDFVGAPGVVVRALGTSVSATTDERGFFQLERLPLGRVTAYLFRRARTGAPAAARLLDPVDAPLDGAVIDLGEIRLFGTGTVVGEVQLGALDRAPKPAEGALVVAPRTVFKAIAENDGTYRLGGLPAGTLDVVSFRSGYDPGRVLGLGVVPGATTRASDMTLFPTDETIFIEVRGRARLFDRDDASGVEIRFIDETTPTRALGPVTTNAEGAFTITASSGVYRARFTRDGYIPVEIPGVAILAEGVIGLLPVVLYPELDNDTDGDGILDDVDPDLDNDGCLNEEDAFPKDAFGCTDTDGDGLADEIDDDDDNDGLSDAEELSPGRDGWLTDPLLRDTDLDGFDDPEDVCPEVADPLQLDSDLDGKGDVCDEETRTGTTAPDAIAIFDVQPRQGAVGTDVLITGLNFSTNPNRSTVRFGDDATNLAQPTLVAPNFLSVEVPEGSTSGVVTVFSGGQAARFDPGGSAPFCFLPAPVVRSFFPQAVRPNGFVQVLGKHISSPACRQPPSQRVHLHFTGPAGATLAVEPVGPVAPTITDEGEHLELLSFQVPLTAVDGPIALETADGIGRPGTPLSILDGPRIDGISPNPAAVGEVVTIVGEGFSTEDVGGGPVTVRFENVAAEQTPAFVASTFLRVAVPAGAQNGRVTVVHPAGDAVSTFDLVVDALAPSVSELVPTLAVADGTESVRVTGRNLATATGVSFNGIASPSVTAADGQITALVPANANPGPVTVTFSGAPSQVTAQALRLLVRTEGTTPTGDIGGGFSNDGSRFFVVGGAGAARIGATLDGVSLASVAADVPLSFLPPNPTLSSFQVAPSGQVGLLTLSLPSTETFVVDLPSFALRGQCAPSRAVLSTGSSRPFVFDELSRYAYALNPTPRPGGSDAFFRIDLGNVDCTLIPPPPPQSTGFRGVLPMGPGQLLVGHATDGAGVLDTDPNSLGVGLWIIEPIGVAIDREQLFWGPGGRYVWGRSPSSGTLLAQFEPFTTSPARTLVSGAIGNSVQTPDRRWLFTGNALVDLVSESTVRTGLLNLSMSRIAAAHPTAPIFVIGHLNEGRIVRFEIRE